MDQSLTCKPQGNLICRQAVSSPKRLLNPSSRCCVCLMGHKVCTERSLGGLLSAEWELSSLENIHDAYDVHLRFSRDTDTVPGQPFGCGLILQPGNTLLSFGCQSSEGQGAGGATAWCPSSVSSSS